MAKSAAAQLLDELMGRNRNHGPDDKPPEIEWSDDEVCKYFLCGFCPHDLFTNTKADLGICDKLHDENFKIEYRKSSRFQRMGYEEEFLRFLMNCMNEKDRRIKRAQSRLELGMRQGQLAANGELKDGKLQMLQERISGLLEQVEDLGSQGKVDEAQGMMKLVEQLQGERDAMRSMAAVELTNSQEKQMEVCQVCGAFLIVGDAQSRIDDHLMGKQHMGYAKIKATLEEMEEKRREPFRRRDEERQKMQEEMEKEREERRKRREERDKEKEQEREESRKKRDKERAAAASHSDRKRSRSRDRKRSRSRERRRSRSRDRPRRSGSRSKDRRHHERDGRERSRDKDRRDRHRRSRSNERRRRSRSRDRHSNTSSRSKDKDRRTTEDENGEQPTVGEGKHAGDDKSTTEGGNSALGQGARDTDGPEGDHLQADADTAATSFKADEKPRKE